MYKITNFKKWYNEKGGKSIIVSLRYNFELLDEVIKRTSFLSDNISTSERVYNLIYDIKETELCPYCSKPKKFHKLNRGYHSTCQTKTCITKHRSVVNRESSKKINWEASKKKAAETYMKRYGARHNWCNNTSSRAKCYKTMIKLYGNKHALQNNSILDKKMNTALERHGTTNFLYCEKSRETIIEKFGIDIYEHNIMSIPEVQQHLKDTCIKLYGVNNPMKNQDIFNKQQISGFKAKRFDKDQKLIYRGSYELDFLQKYYDKIEIDNGKSFKFIYDEKNKSYHSDYFIEVYNLIIEIKSKYYFEKFKKLNLSKQQACLNQGYNFIFIIDKDYGEFDKIINKKRVT